MRLLTLAVIGLILASTPVAYQAYGQNASRNYGSVTCRQTFPCDLSGMSASALFPVANSCINMYFGYPIGDGFFDESEGLDSNNCMAAKPDILPKGVGSQLQPSCCVIPKDGDNICQLHCSLISQ